ncbi:MAG TPA: tRNA-dihydrouridine synthase family protein [Desulfotignum sp.]|nr:tRNA-dihydrouridine synthase family protein [Desulfotignum sp.]
MVQNKTRQKQAAMDKKDPILILAPLQGFTDVTFRNVYAKHFCGLDAALAPFISTMGQQRLKPSRIRDVAPRLNQDLPVTPQILGNVAEDFIFLAGRLADMGHDLVNWNLGCPHSKIAKKGRGSGLLLFPEKIDALLDRIIPDIPMALSVKIRLGRKSKDEIHDLISVLDRHDLDHIILHPRTGIQMYQGTADHDAFGTAMAQSRHNFVYNGDITDIRSFLTVKNRFAGINRFMIGRGILANPFLPEEIKGVPRNPDDRLVRLQAFHDDLLAAYSTIISGPGHLIGRMKGFWNYLGPSFKNHKKPVKNILKSTSIQSYTHNVAQFFAAQPVFCP